MPADRYLNHLHLPFREKVVKIIEEMNRWCDKHAPGYEVALNEGFRTAAYQNELYQKGRTKPGSIVTQRDGYKKRSNHQSSLAADLVPKKNGKWTWSAPAELWAYLGHCARSEGLTYGGDWAMRDYPHIEWPESDKALYAKAREWQKTQGIG